MAIRQFRREDTSGVQLLLEQGRPYVVPYSEYVYWILSRYCGPACLVAEQDGEITGFLAAVPSCGRGCLFIWQIAVALQERQRGIGAALLEEAKRQAGKMGLRRIEISIDRENEGCNRLLEKAAASWKGRISVAGAYRDDTFSETVYSVELPENGMP